MNEKFKKILTIVGVIAFIAIGIIWIFGRGIEHIEDTNGPDDYSLTTITDENIINLDVSAINVKTQNSLISDTITYSSNKFSGVYEVFLDNVITNYFEITVNHTQVNSGNFRMVLLVNDEIVHDFNLNKLTQTYSMENVAGTVSLRIAGESADFMFDYSIL